MTGENCTSTCATRDHASFGECVKSKGVKVAYCNSFGGADYTRQKQGDKELAAYAAARKEGIQPASTRLADTQQALSISDRQGEAFKA